MNEYTDANGVKYEARANTGCTGCAHDPDLRGCANSPPCTGNIREDGRNIAWVRQEKV